MFSIVFLKKTGQIVRNGYFGESLVLAKDEDVLTFDDWTDFSGKAVDVKTRALIAATEKTRYSFRGQLGEPWEGVRAKRDELLTQTDFLMMPDYPIDAEYRANLAAYRQALRDITLASDPTLVSWPEKPTK